MDTIKRELDEIKIFVAVATVLVVLIHLTSEPLSLYLKPSVASVLFFILNRGSSFVVPAFVFISAFKNYFSIANGKAFHFVPFIRKRTVKVLVPYIIFSLIYYWYFCYRGFAVFDLNTILYKLLTGSVSVPFYFVTIIMQFYFLMPLSVCVVKKVPLSVVIASAFIITLFFKQFAPTYGAGTPLIDFYMQYNDRLFVSYLIYWVLGLYAARYYDIIKCFVTRRKIFIAALTYAIIASVHMYFTYESFAGITYFPYGEITAMFFNIASISLLLVLSMAIDGLKLRAVRFITGFLDKHSFNIFLTHVFFIYLCEHLFYLFGIDKISERFLIKSAFVAVYTVAAVLLINIVMLLINIIVSTVKKSFNRH